MGSAHHAKKIVYNTMIADIFHYGHLQSLKFAKSQGDYLICGVLTDKASKFYKKTLISNFNERKAIISSLNIIDEVMVQDSKNPTRNLKKLHARFPGAKLVLMHGDDWRKIPGEDYVRRIGGEVITHPYYTKLSDFKIINKFLERYKDKFSSSEELIRHIELSDFTYFNPRKLEKTIFSSKADTLKYLAPLLKKSKIERMLVFTVLDWKEERDNILKKIQDTFYGKIVVRSSAINEDSHKGSMAGYFHSELDIPSSDRQKVTAAVNSVIDSYKNKKSEFQINQILVQSQTKDVILSGVLFTRGMDGSPYYIINYDEDGSTDSVTKGIGGKSIKISRFAVTTDIPPFLRTLMDSAFEIEKIIPAISLDMEFALTKSSQVVIFQVRPLFLKEKKISDNAIKRKIESLKKEFTGLCLPKRHLAGSSNIFGDMPDWNPAEIIGDAPNFLDYSLYDYVIMSSAWHEARASQGYYNVDPAELMVLFGNKPYVNVRNTFNSFIPADLDRKLREKLMNFFFYKLRKHPELQDKVEFEIVYSCYDFLFDERAKELKSFGFSTKEIDQLRLSLLRLTNNLILKSKNSIWVDVNQVMQMKLLREKIKLGKKDAMREISNAKSLLDDCRNNGTVQFSRLARLAFVGNIILKSMVRKKILDEQFYSSFMSSINTVAKKMNRDFNQFTQGNLPRNQFFSYYGHLRPGTYDITSMRYDRNPEILKIIKAANPIEGEPPSFDIKEDIHEKISRELKIHSINIKSRDFLEFVRSAIESRELSKFEFTKSLSDAIELIADAGKRLGFSRKELALLDLPTIFAKYKNKDDLILKWRSKIKERKNERMVNEFLMLPPIIFSTVDFDIVSYYAPKPNFITQKKTKADIAVIGGNDQKGQDISNKIVLLENGDPGYDWIFTKNPAGLVTKYGGVASHMSIRSAEFGLPSAIGCGQIFDKLKGKKTIILDCKMKKITVVQ